MTPDPYEAACRAHEAEVRPETPNMAAIYDAFPALRAVVEAAHDVVEKKQLWSQLGAVTRLEAALDALHGRAQ